MQLVSLILIHWIVIYLMDCQPMIKQLVPDLMQIFSRLEIHLSVINFVAQNEILGKNGFTLVWFL